MGKSVGVRESGEECVCERERESEWRSKRERNIDREREI